MSAVRAPKPRTGAVPCFIFVHSLVLAIAARLRHISDAGQRRRCIRLLSGASLHWAIKFERYVRRRLIAMPAKSQEEAEKKILHIMAATIAGKLPLEKEEVATICGSIAPFKSELRDIFARR